MIKTTNKNIINPVEPISAGIEQIAGEFNYNKYLTLSPLFKSLIVSSTAGGKYNLNVTDNKLGFYFYYREAGLQIKVPLTAIFNTNNKIQGILGIAFSTAGECPSRARGLCQLENVELCYAHVGERQGTKKPFNYLMGMDSYKNSLLSAYYFNLFYADPTVQQIFKQYCIYYNINTLRFNLKGDFKTVNDIKCIEYIADWGFIQLTGYTARDDLRNYLFNMLNKHDNIILNGSNIMYSNIFNAVDSIKELLTAPRQCKGGCLKNGCLNCYKLKGEVITVLIHGSQAGVKLNTADNRVYMANVLNIAGFNITPADLNRSKNIFFALKNYFKKHDLFKKVPPMFLKTNKQGELIFDGQGAVINYLRYILKSAGVDPANIKGEL